MKLQEGKPHAGMHAFHMISVNNAAFGTLFSYTTLTLGPTS